MKRETGRIWVTVGTVALFSLTGPGLASAQVGKLTGVVTDVSTAEPLAGAQVFLEGVGIGTLTAENGRYFIINVPVGHYTVVASVIGYQTVRKTDIVVSIDVTRTVNFELTPEAVAVEEIRVEVERLALVPPGQTGTVNTLSADEIRALPVTDLTGALSLQQGFLEVPVDNTVVVSYAEQRQGVTSLRIRGGRGAETVTLIDGIPINNFVLGGPAFDITTKAIEQVDFYKGHFEPQYGNALSGIINIATREGGSDLKGAVEYQTSEVGGVLGNTSDDLLGFDLFEGYVAGPVPGTNFGAADPRLRFMVAGRQTYGNDRVLEFDNDVFDPGVTCTRINCPHPLDLIAGWRAVGYDSKRDIFSKLTYYFTPTAKLSATWMNYERQRRTFEFDWMLSIDPLDWVDTPQDSAFYERNTRFLQWQEMAQNSIDLDRNLWVAKWDHTVGRTAYQLRLGLFDQKRVTCNVFSGICLGDHFEDPNFDGGFAGPGPGVFSRTPTAGTDFFFGGEDLRTQTYRGDIQSQVTDHHNLAAGVFYQRHDLEYNEVENVGINDIILRRNVFKQKPWDLAFYVQDKIEYDFLTVKLGFRVDYGKAPGLAFANPADPNNGTTALQVCANPADPRWGIAPADQPRFQDACGDPLIREEAALIATVDDFKEADARSQFSPRIGVSFPVTASSQLFFNFGRNSQNPILRNLYWNTKIGTSEEGQAALGCTEPGGCLDLRRVEGQPVFLGNPRLLIESTTNYEVGYVQEVGDNYALDVILFSKDQFGLTGIRNVGFPPFTTFDPGATYGTNNPRYVVLVNADFTTTRGLELRFRRRLADYWGFDVNYSFAQSTTNSADLPREFESQTREGDPEIRQEITSEVNQPHVFNGVLRFQAGAEPPETPLGSALRHTSLSIAVQAASGLPYTPTLSFGGFGDLGQLERFSAQAPATWQVNLIASKDFSIANVRYGVFLRVNNLFDRKNCSQVFETTGDCFGGTEDQNRRRAGNAVGSTTDSTFFDRPQYLGERRNFNFGLRATF